MIHTTNEQAIIERVERELVTGESFRLIERSEYSRFTCGDRIPARSQDWARLIGALAKYAEQGDRAAQAVATVLGGGINPYLTNGEILAKVAAGFAKVVQNGWDDVIGRTGPEPGRPSAYQHDTTLVDAIHLRLAFEEARAAFEGSEKAGVGWVLEHLIERENITVFAHYLPRVAKRLNG